MGILQKISYAIVTRVVQSPNYTQQEMQEYQDGFATGYPLVGQPEYPVHNSAAYRRGLRYGRKSFKQTGSPQIPYEPPIEEE